MKQNNLVSKNHEYRVKWENNFPWPPVEIHGAQVMDILLDLSEFGTCQTHVYYVGSAFVMHFLYLTVFFNVYCISKYQGMIQNIYHSALRQYAH